MTHLGWIKQKFSPIFPTKEKTSHFKLVFKKNAQIKNFKGNKMERTYIFVESKNKKKKGRKGAFENILKM